MPQSKPMKSGSESDVEVEVRQPVTSVGQGSTRRTDQHHTPREEGFGSQRLRSSRQYELRSASRIPNHRPEFNVRHSRVDGFITACRSAMTSMSQAVTTFSRRTGLTSSPSPSPRRISSTAAVTKSVTSQPPQYVEQSLGARPKQRPVNSQTTFLLDVERAIHHVDGTERQGSVASPFEMRSLGLSSMYPDGLEQGVATAATPLVQGPVMSSWFDDSLLVSKPRIDDRMSTSSTKLASILR